MLFKMAEGWGGKILSFLRKILPVRLLSGEANEQNIIKRKKREEMKIENFLLTKRNYSTLFM